MNNENKKLTTGAFFWCWICFLANFGLAFLNVLFLLNSEYASIFDYIIIFSIIIITAGYAVLIVGKKIGFYIICGASLLGMIFCIIGRNFLLMGNFLNPIITWLLIRRNWNLWSELDNNIKLKNIKLIPFLIQLFISLAFMLTFYYILEFTLFKNTDLSPDLIALWGGVILGNITYKLIEKKIGIK